jgi:ABC-type multidrug transport system ATPase subunit
MTISASGLGKRFNREWIFCGLNQKFETGKTYAIIGPNGSGKSTLMQVLWGQVPASEGKIEYRLTNEIISEEKIHEHIAIATPYMDLIEEFTLEEQVSFHFKFKKPLNDLSLTGIILKMQLGQAFNKPIKQFSSGMRQRLKLGLAMFSQSEILFLDEPTTNLDQASANWYMDNLMEIHGKKLILIATNQPSDHPKEVTTINLADLKQVTNRREQSIQNH